MMAQFYIAILPHDVKMCKTSYEFVALNAMNNWYLKYYVNPLLPKDTIWQGIVWLLTNYIII